MSSIEPDPHSPRPVSDSHYRSTAPTPAPSAEPATPAKKPDTTPRILPADRAEQYSSRWDQLKGDFVDQPRDAVGQADQLVRDVLDELHDSFGRQRYALGHGLDSEQTTTEDMRSAFGSYRKFFDRLLEM